MVVVCVRPCVVLCEWVLRVGRSLIPQAGAAHSSARSGVSRCSEGWVGDDAKVCDQKGPQAALATFLQHSDLGGPGDL